MRILNRYLAGQFLAPVLFAFAAMTSIMLLNQVARRFGALVGKGLPWSVIGEVFWLCLPFIIAMTLPMAVLVAMLYTFSHLAADSEITAMRASGVSVTQLLRPMLVVGGLFCAFNFWFSDQILPDSNARLRNLLINIQRKKPTLELREQVVNEIPPSGLFLRASRIDATTGRLRSVTIYDMGTGDSRRIIYADSGIMGFTENAEDLHFLLFSGFIHTYKSSEPQSIQVTGFSTNNILVRNVSNRLDLESSDGVRGDREMSTCEMMGVVRDAQYDEDVARARRRGSLARDLRSLLVLGPGPDDQPVRQRPLPAYCRWFAALGRLTGTGKPDSAAHPSTNLPAFPAPVPPPRLASSPPPPSGAKVPAVLHPGPDTPLTRRVALTAVPATQGPGRAHAPPRDTVRPPPLPSPAPSPAPPRHTPIILTNWSEIASAADQIKTAELRADQYEVEVHKKWAISVACIVFVIVGIPMALRFPRGGMGLVIGGGLFVFAIYYIGLIAGEGLGDKDIVDPWLAMWGPNIVFACLGLFGLYRVSRESGSARGGDLREFWEGITGRFRRRRAT